MIKILIHNSINIPLSFLCVCVCAAVAIVNDLSLSSRIIKFIFTIVFVSTFMKHIFFPSTIFRLVECIFGRVSKEDGSLATAFSDDER